MARRRLTGVLLVGGASARFGSPKALARLDGETLAERGWRVLGEACDERIAVGKEADALDLPFPLTDDGTDVRHPAAGLIAGLRAARNDVAVFLPVDCPGIGSAALRRLGEACADVAVPAADRPLPGAFRKSALPGLERCLDDRRSLASAVAELDVRTLPLDPFDLADVDTPDDLRRLEARERALRAAVSVANQQGLDPSSAYVLRDWNDTVVHLAPSHVVARVRTSWVGTREPPEQTYAREIRVARHIAGGGGPIVRPAANAGPFREDGLTVALWEYVEVLPSQLTAGEVGLALRDLHAALDGFEGELPSLDDRLDRAAEVIGDRAAVPLLGEADRAFLETAFRGLRVEASARPLATRILHGGAHAGNLLPTRKGPRWIDLDTVCRGPLEWDLATVGSEAASAFSGYDHKGLELMGRLVSAEVAIWCWHTYGRAPEVDQAAHYHLEALRR